MYIHKQGRVRYRTLCGVNVPDRAISNDRDKVTCEQCLMAYYNSQANSATITKKLFYATQKLEMGEPILKPGETIRGMTNAGKPYIMGHNYTVIFPADT